MNLLYNKLIIKYFGDDGSMIFSGKLYSPGNDCDTDWMVRSVIARRVINAMQEPIKKGERCLYVDGMQAVWDRKWSGESLPDYHPEFLRLPDAFQDKSDPVEEKSFESISRKLDQLLELIRKS